MKRYNDFTERKKFIESLYDGGVKIRNLLRCTCPPLHEAFLSGGEFFEHIAMQIKEGKLPERAVEDSLKKYDVLKSEDKAYILRFARGLDAVDCNGQLSNIEIFINDMHKALEDAKAEIDTKGRLYVKGSILTATAVVLLLI